MEMDNVKMVHYARQNYTNRFISLFAGCTLQGWAAIVRMANVKMVHNVRHIYTYRLLSLFAGCISQGWPAIVYSWIPCNAPESLVMQSKWKISATYDSFYSWNGQRQNGSLYETNYTYRLLSLFAGCISQGWPAMVNWWIPCPSPVPRLSPVRVMSTALLRGADGGLT